MAESKGQQTAAKLTEDVKPSWLNPIRAVQASCKNNRGYAVVTIRVLVKKNDAIAWSEPELEKIHPARLAELNLSPSFLAMMLKLSESSEVDNKD